MQGCTDDQFPLHILDKCATCTACSNNDVCARIVELCGDSTTAPQVMCEIFFQRLQEGLCLMLVTLEALHTSHCTYTRWRLAMGRGQAEVLILSLGKPREFVAGLLKIC